MRTMIDIYYYLTAAGTNIVEMWLDALQDKKAAARIATRITRLATGNSGTPSP